MIIFLDVLTAFRDWLVLFLLAGAAQCLLRHLGLIPAREPTP